jgi:hypothetical protein
MPTLVDADFFRSVLEGRHAGVWVVDRSGKILSWTMVLRALPGAFAKGTDRALGGSQKRMWAMAARGRRMTTFSSKG